MVKTDITGHSRTYQSCLSLRIQPIKECITFAWIIWMISAQYQQGQVLRVLQKQWSRQTYDCFWERKMIDISRLQVPVQGTVCVIFRLWKHLKTSWWAVTLKEKVRHRIQKKSIRKRSGDVPDSLKIYRGKNCTIWFFSLITLFYIGTVQWLKLIKTNHSSQ